MATPCRFPFIWGMIFALNLRMSRGVGLIKVTMIINARIKVHLMANCERNSSRLRCWININASCMGPTITCSVISPFYNVSPITRSVSNTHLKKEIRYLLDWFPVIGQVLAIHMNNKKSILNMHTGTVFGIGALKASNVKTWFHPSVPAKVFPTATLYLVP